VNIIDDFFLYVLKPVIKETIQFYTIFSAMTSSPSAPLAPQCDICCSSESILNCDTVHQVEGISSHYFCLLFSSGLGQRGEEREGVKGFLAGDIRREVRRGARLKCVYCRKKGATVGCAEQRCKKSYHPHCGKKHNSLFQFFDQFKSFCKEHRPVQMVRKVEGRGSSGSSTCTICQDRLVRKATLKTLWSPCCSSFYHRDCVQSMAVSAGKEHMRCPNCNDTEMFLLEMREVGVYVPEQDASWEAKGNFEEQDRERVLACYAKLCFCPHVEGRGFHSEGGLWEVVGCETCGSKGIHARCGGMEDMPEAVWHCYTCREGLKGRGEEQTYLQHTSKLWGKREEAFSSSLSLSSLSTPSPATSFPPSPNPLLSALLASLPPVEEKTFTSLVIPVLKQKQSPAGPLLLPPPAVVAPVEQRQNYDATRTLLTKINSRTSFTDLLGSMLDTGDGSPGDSDYESSQDNGVASTNHLIPPTTPVAADAGKKKLHVKRLTLARNESPGSQSRMTDFFSSQKSF